MKHLSILILLITLPLVSFSQSREYAREILDQLCASSFDGRGYVNGGERKAADYIKKEMQSMGLKAYTEDYFQKFNLSANTLGGKLCVKINKKKLEPGVDYLIDAEATTQKATYPVKKVSAATLKDEQGLANTLLNSGPVFLLIDTEEFTDKEDGRFLYELAGLIKCHPDQNISIKGAIFLSPNKLTWTPGPMACERTVIRLLKKNAPEKIEKISIDVVNQFHEKYPSQNVIGYIPGKVHPDSLIVMTAHYDHLGRMGKDTYFPGANDNASGIAMMLNVAKHYAQNRPDKSMVFMAFGSEEIGLIGSRFFVENPLFPLANINFLINLDILGTGEDGIQVVNGSIHRDKFDRMVAMNSDNDWLKQVKIRGSMCKSDHCFFHEKGVPAFYIYTLGGVAFYHDIYDKSETLPLTEFEDIMQLLIHFIAEL